MTNASALLAGVSRAQESLVPSSGDVANVGFRLSFDITESAMMQNPGAISMLLSRLKDVKIGLDIDNFGTGYSSLSQLQHCPCRPLRSIAPLSPGWGRTMTAWRSFGPSWR